MKIRRVLKSLLLCLSAALGMAACDVHEFPPVPQSVPLYVKLNADLRVTEWDQFYQGSGVLEQGLGPIYNNVHEEGHIRYIVRAYPITSKSTASPAYAQEFVFERDLAGDLDFTAALDLVPGEYDIRVWADLLPGSGHTPFYNADDFAEITLQGKHRGSTNYRDVFRGSAKVSLAADILEREPLTLEIDLQRPLAKFEFITTDLTGFIHKQYIQALAKLKAQGETKAEETALAKAMVNIADYRVVFYYVGFMPNAYNMFTDKPVDALTGVFFESSLNCLSQTEASLGFDYVFVNGTASTVTVQIGIYDNEGTQLSLTDPIPVPLKRNHHTVMRGMFLMTESSGGVSIHPDYDGDYNLIFP